ncbi:LysR family transcriptional regulator [Paraglaciecola hydrolytica]|uniref:LysR family transcriptional regulator n=1 Tax=Paraglaciecola hydrolytica TaxID=1799789 RepID=A0A136A701_9ALTE|nr:LysR family transcriptional regulator [Paraglaciecola hydrolytica]KXI30984.1 LysR family transcriptional regulator [Paraglaciecola hydrolytica]
MDRITAAQVFVSIVEQGSMVGAAQSLDMSRSMVTRYLSEMESWAAAQLLHRSTRKLTLTAAGEKAYVNCRSILDVAKELSTPLEQDQVAQPQGTIRIACSQFVAADLLPSFIDGFLDDYPKVHIDVHISNQLTNLVENRIDLALRITNELDPNIIARPLGRCRSVLCATEGYLKQHGYPVYPDELVKHNCLIYSNFGKSLWHFTKDEQAVVAAVSGNYSANESMLLLQSVLKGRGISLQPKHAVQALINDKKLVHVLPNYEPATLGIYAIYRSRKHQSLAIRKLLERLISYFEITET